VVEREENEVAAPTIRRGKRMETGKKLLFRWYGVVRGATADSRREPQKARVTDTPALHHLPEGNGPASQYGTIDAVVAGKGGFIVKD